MIDVKTLEIRKHQGTLHLFFISRYLFIRITDHVESEKARLLRFNSIEL